jgi:hypothetical protein
VARRIVNIEALPDSLPDVIVLGRADVYDRNLIVTTMLGPGLYQPVARPQGFEIWEK